MSASEEVERIKSRAMDHFGMYDTSDLNEFIDFMFEECLEVADFDGIDCWTYKPSEEEMAAIRIERERLEAEREQRNREALEERCQKFGVDPKVLP